MNRRFWVVVVAWAIAVLAVRVLVPGSVAASLVVGVIIAVAVTLARRIRKAGKEDLHQINKRMAYQAVRRALSAGSLIRPDRCSECEAIGPVHAHHWHGYAPQHWLDVQWLCPRCHAGAHRKEVAHV